MIAESYYIMPAYAYLSPREALPPEKAAVQKALTIDPSLAEAHTALASILSYYDWNWVEAECEFKWAIELDPNSSASHYRYGQHLVAIGRMDESIAELKHALELEPLSNNSGANLAIVYSYARKNEQALEQAKKTYDLEPNFVNGRLVLGVVYNGNRLYDDAIRLSENSLHTEPTNQFMLWIGGYAYAKSGRRREAEEFINRSGGRVCDV